MAAVSNLITNSRAPDSGSLKMSNGLTSVLFDVLVLAGSDLAITLWEKSLVYWLAQHDQSRIGSGCAGFDIQQMGWTRDAFDVQQRFVLAMIDTALARGGWERLPFSPKEEIVIDALRRFHQLVAGFSVDLISSLPETAWIPTGEQPEVQCQVHRVYLHETGCILCNDAPIDIPPEAAPNRSQV